jgi:hypothetical protein
MAFRNALVDLKYGYNLIGGSSVAFRFDSPKTFQPRRDQAKQTELAAVNSSNRGIVSRYKELKLGSNDPNLIPGDAAGLISDFTNLYGQSFFKQVWAMFYKQADRTLVELLEAIAKLFRPG